MIVSREVEKHLTKFNIISFDLKRNISKLGIERNLLNLIKKLYKT